MIQLSRTQDEEVGDGTTSVIILAGELLQVGAGTTMLQTCYPFELSCICKVVARSWVMTPPA
jgi:T-complex protein 1 subunit gamma